jgi:glyoxylase-like metal-dependent hydrolase (beta-lactamase superfamily II)
MKIASLLKLNPFAARSYGELKQVTPRVYIYRNITNSSFVIGDDSVAVIDTQVNHPLAERLLAHIRSVTDKPIKYAINTHYHWDHTNGNALFQNQGAVLISSKLTHEFMVTRHDRQKAFLLGRGFEIDHDPVLPEITFEGEYSLNLGNMPLRLFFAGKAESDDAIAVHVEREKVLMAGDTIMTGSFPIFGQPVWDEGLEGTGQWQATINNLMRYEPEHIIPGHGPLAYDKEVKLLLEIENYYVTEVKKRVDKGLDLDATLRDMESKLPRKHKKIAEVWGTPRYAILRVYRSLTRQADDTQPGWQHLKPSAILSPEREKTYSGQETLSDLIRMAHEAHEGGDEALRLDVLKRAADIFRQEPDVLAAYADALIESSRKIKSVLEKGDYFSVSKSMWDKALQINPIHIASLLGKGRYLVMLSFRGGDDPKRGMECLRLALSLKPNNMQKAEIEFYLGIGYRRLGDEKQACIQFEKALLLNPAFAPARMAKSA